MAYNDGRRTAHERLTKHFKDMEKETFLTKLNAITQRLQLEGIFQDVNLYVSIKDYKDMEDNHREYIENPYITLDVCILTDKVPVMKVRKNGFNFIIKLAYCKQTDGFYYDYQDIGVQVKTKLPEPKKEKTLRDYIVQLAELHKKNSKNYDVDKEWYQQPITSESMELEFGTRCGILKLICDEHNIRFVDFLMNKTVFASYTNFTNDEKDAIHKIDKIVNSYFINNIIQNC